MHLHHSLDDLRLASSFLTIGSFDGVHSGHQQVILALVQAARQAGEPSIAITFHPHPAVVLRGIIGPFYLTHPQDRAELLASLGIDHVILLSFDQDLAQQTAHQFMQRCVQSLGMRQLWAGYDLKLGKNQEGTPLRLTQIGVALGFSVHILPPLQNQQGVISSSLIRQFITRGDVSSAANLLGRNYALQGSVVHGDGRGREIGFPTANLSIWVDQLLPARGVYATIAWYDGKPYPSVTNIGFRPTFENIQRLRIETHLLDFNQMIYNQALKIEFIQQLRQEKRYLSNIELVNQIKLDIDQARKVFSDAGQTPGLPA